MCQGRNTSCGFGWICGTRVLRFGVVAERGDYRGPTREREEIREVLVFLMRDSFVGGNMPSRKRVLYESYKKSATVIRE